MTKKIESLSPEQTEMLEAYRQKGLEIGLRCDGVIDKDVTTKAINKCYESAGLSPPSEIRFVDGPIHGVIVYNEIVNPDGKTLQWPSWCWGQHDINWIIFHKFFKEQCGVDIPQIDEIYEVAINCGWFIPMRDVCIVTPPPCELHLQDGELHNTEGPAVRYADGTEVWSINGLRITDNRYKCHVSEWKSEWLLDESNAEMRRCLIETMGYERILDDLSATRLDKWREYELFRIEQDFDVEPVVLVKMTCPSTGMIHVNRVPPDTTSARDGITWCNWGIDPEEFAAEA